VGEIEQVPPAYSAARIEGRRAYALARRGEDVTLAPRLVRIDRIDLLSYSWPNLELDVYCGKGTYIRAIARDLGVALGVGGYIAALRRLRIGTFAVEMAVPLDAQAETARDRLQPIAFALDGLPTVRVTADEAHRLGRGNSIAAQGDGEVVVLNARGELVAMGSVVNGVLKPEKVFVTRLTLN
jgi:tRNA pseudouridine55 synthase